MKTLLIIGLMFSTPVYAGDYGYGTGSNQGDHFVNGYTTGRGTYVEPHYQTNPNGTTSDNYGSRGNYNPHTGGYGVE